MSANFWALLAGAGASFSFVANGWAFLRVRQHGSPGWTRLLLLNAILSFFYIGAWSYLVFHNVTPVDRAYWSEIVTPISTLTFFTVWTGPALLIGLHTKPETAGGDNGL